MIGQTKIAHTVNANSTADGSTAIDVSQYIQEYVIAAFSIFQIDDD